MLWLNITVTAIAGLLVLMGWLGKEEKYRKIGLPLAFALLIFNTALTVSKDITQSRIERERKADLIYIQKLNSPVYRLGFVFTTAPIDTLETPKLRMLFRMDIDLTELGYNRHFAGVLNLCFNSNSGWTICYNEFLGQEEISLELDSSKKCFRFWLNEFAIPWRGQVVWRSKNVADLSNLTVQLILEPEDAKLWAAVPPKITWCPVKKIEMFVNSMKAENLVFTAPPHLSQGPWQALFAPVAEAPFSDTLNGTFHINPIWLRNSILNSLE